MFDYETNGCHQAYELWKEGKGMEVMDDSLDDRNSECKLVRCMEIALLCVQEHASDRPSMLQVCAMLRNQDKSHAIPKKPAFSRVEDKDDVNECQTLQNVSVDDGTITQIVGR